MRSYHVFVGLLVAVFTYIGWQSFLQGQGPAGAVLVDDDAETVAESNSLRTVGTLRGSITPERGWWDLRHYHLDIAVDPVARTVGGVVYMRYRVTGPQNRLQIELQDPMVLHKVVQNGRQLSFTREHYSYFITLEETQVAGEDYTVEMHYSGAPKVAPRAPWDGGFTWKQDANGKPFAANANQYDGASLWWPNKDHPADEPDEGVMISAEVPEDLMNVSNGRLVKVDEHPGKGTKTWHWQVVNPINNYGVNVNIGDYVHFSETYAGEKGPLTMDYYVLRDNLDKAKEQFQQAPMVMESMEHWFGPYPFYKDGFKLVEAPYLGMEHQSSVTYGNGYQNGYKGADLSQSGWGMKFDFIIEHETGHEWFANNITHKDPADLWIHEGFTAYSEGLHVEYHFGKEAGAAYIRGVRSNIENKTPLIVPYNQHISGSRDVYYKGSNMLHTIRQIVDDDTLWRQTLRGLNETFYHQTVWSADIENYISEKTGNDLSKLFDQYLRDPRIPVLEHRYVNGQQLVRWSGVVDGFDMPVKVWVDGTAHWIIPTVEWKPIEGVSSTGDDRPDFIVDRDFYVAVLDLTGG